MATAAAGVRGADAWVAFVLLVVALGLFIASNLALGLTFSTVAATSCRRCRWRSSRCCRRSCCRASCFRSAGMPIWAQWAGEVFPLTHCLRIVRGVLLKGNGVARNPAGVVADRGVHLDGGGDRGLVVS